MTNPDHWWRELWRRWDFEKAQMPSMEPRQYLEMQRCFTEAWSSMVDLLWDEMKDQASRDQSTRAKTEGEP